MMHKLERQKNLIDLLSANSVMTISDLAMHLDSSMMTIRRDLDDLEKKGTVKKIHGGALLVRHEPEQPPFQQRVKEYEQEKYRIGKAASEMITKGSIVFFDAGTTSLAIIEHIPDDIEFTAITPGILTAAALCAKPKANTIIIGGNVHPTSFSSTNYIAVDLIRKFNADIAFISTKAITLSEGTFEAQLPLIEVKKAIVDSSRKAVLLADHSKFESKSLCFSIPIEDIDTIITDNEIPDTILDMLKNSGKDFILA